MDCHPERTVSTATALCIRHSADVTRTRWRILCRFMLVVLQYLKYLHDTCTELKSPGGWHEFSHDYWTPLVNEIDREINREDA